VKEHINKKTLESVSNEDEVFVNLHFKSFILSSMKKTIQ
jgi:hypothetical protein